MFDFSDQTEFIASCLEDFKTLRKMTRKDVNILFKKYDVYDYINFCYETLHTMNGFAIVDNITVYIENKKKDKQDKKICKY